MELDELEVSYLCASADGRRQPVAVAGRGTGRPRPQLAVAARGEHHSGGADPPQRLLLLVPNKGAGDAAPIGGGQQVDQEQAAHDWDVKALRSRHQGAA